jgi:hypothetical protein
MDSRGGSSSVLMIWSQPGSGSLAHDRPKYEHWRSHHALPIYFERAECKTAPGRLWQSVVSDFSTENNHGNAGLGVSLWRDPL